MTGDTAFKAFHLYKYEGWTEIDDSKKALKSDAEYQQIYKATLPAINEQFSELTKAFSFWPSPDKRVGNNIYDIRYSEGDKTCNLHHVDVLDPIP